MDVSGGAPAEPLEPITKASVISSNAGPIHLNNVRSITGSPYQSGSVRGIGARIKDARFRRQQGSAKPMDDNAFLKALAVRAEFAIRYLDGEIATNQVNLGDLDERLQGLGHEIQDTQQYVEDGKLREGE